MAMPGTQSPTKLVLHPRPTPTRYNRLVLYLIGGAAVLVVLAYYLVVTSVGPRRDIVERPSRLYVNTQPLLADPPPPPPPPQQQQTLPPPPPPPPAPRQVKRDKLADMRREEWIKALRAPIHVSTFTPNGHTTNGAGHVPAQTTSRMQLQAPAQVLEIPQHWNSQTGVNTRGPTQNDWHAYQGHGPTWNQPIPQAGQYLTAHVQPPRSPYQVNAGLSIPVTLAQDITSDADGPVNALVNHDVYDSVTGRFLLIPAGSRLFGVTDVDEQANQQPMLLLAFKTLYFPNGHSVSVEGMPATTQLGLIGLRDAVNRHFVQRYGSAAVLSLITAGIRLATYQNRGFYTYAPEDAAVYGAGSVLGRTVGEELRRSLNIRPTVMVRLGYSFTVTVTQDIVFPGPYPFTQAAQHDNGGWQ